MTSQQRRPPGSSGAGRRWMTSFRARSEGGYDGMTTEANGPGDDCPAGIRVRLDELLAERDMTLTELAGRVGITIVNLSILKNGRARAIRFSTLARLCEALGCQPGDLLDYPRAQALNGSRTSTPA